MQVVVVLKEPISIAELSDLRARTNIAIQSVEGRFNSVNGQRTTVTWLVDDQSDLHSSVLDNAQADISTKSGTTQFAGIYSFRAVIDRTSYDLLAKEPEVFFADVTIDQIRQDIGESIPLEKFSMVSEPNVFWTMEDLGLSNFQ